jgi:hypothetical protein
MTDKSQLRREFATKLRGLFAESTKLTFEIGDTLLAPQERLGHGVWQLMCREDLKRDPSTCFRPMAIAKDERLRAHVHDLPSAWGTLYELT